MSIQSNDSNNAERHKVEESVEANHCTPNPCAYICPAHPAEFIQCNVPVFRVKCSELSLRDAPINVRGDLQQLRGMARYGSASLGVQIRIEVNANCNDNPFVLELPEDASLYLHINGTLIQLNYTTRINEKIGNNVLVLNYLETSSNELENYLNNMQECDDKFDITFDSVTIGQVLACAKLNSSCEILRAKLSFVNIEDQGGTGTYFIRDHIPLVLQ